MVNVKKNKVEAGSIGGRTTLKKYGREHFSRLGKWGAHVMHARYRLEPMGQSDFVLVDRRTNQPKARLSGRPLE